MPKRPRLASIARGVLGRCSRLNSGIVEFAPLNGSPLNGVYVRTPWRACQRAQIRSTLAWWRKKTGSLGDVVVQVHVAPRSLREREPAVGARVAARLHLAGVQVPALEPRAEAAVPVGAVVERRDVVGAHRQRAFHLSRR